jgi:CRISPR-associated endoribonuclease Cas6
MKFKLTLNIDRKYGDCLPMNYQYEQSAVIYRILASADKNYSTWLHNNGFQLDNGKRFKLFCYSRFIFEKYRVMPKAHCMNIIGNKVEWYLSFLPEKSTVEFVQGVFSFQHFIIGNKDYKVAFDVVNIETLPEENLIEEESFRANSPICIKEKVGNNVKYLDPHDEHYVDGVLKGLLSRYEAFYQKPFNGDLSSFEFKVLDETPKPVLVTIKANTVNQTHVKGYMFKFILRAPVELKKIAYESGIGEQCSQGFGYIEKNK